MPANRHARSRAMTFLVGGSVSDPRSLSGTLLERTNEKENALDRLAAARCQSHNTETA
jgi:hypothetical protein